MKELPLERPVHSFAVSRSEREQSRRTDYGWHKDHCAIGCYMKVWDEGVGEYYTKERRHEIVVETDRRNFCFFWAYHPGMQFSAAATLQKRQAAYKDAGRDRRLTIVGLWIAALALVVGVVLQLVFNS